MNILAIDYGTKNIGLAKSAIGIDLVLPLGRLENKSEEFCQKKLLEIIYTEKIDRLVVGLPFGLDGAENKNTQRIRNFASGLEKLAKIPVDFISEIFSSQAGDRTSGGVSRDEKAAMIILQSYLDKNKV